MAGTRGANWEPDESFWDESVAESSRRPSHDVSEDESPTAAASARLGLSLAMVLVVGIGLLALPGGGPPALLGIRPAFFAGILLGAALLWLYARWTRTPEGRRFSINPAVGISSVFLGQLIARVSISVSADAAAGVGGATIAAAIWVLYQLATPQPAVRLRHSVKSVAPVSLDAWDSLAAPVGWIDVVSAVLLTGVSTFMVLGILAQQHDALPWRLPLWLFGGAIAVAPRVASVLRPGDSRALLRARLSLPLGFLAVMFAGLLAVKTGVGTPIAVDVFMGFITGVICLYACLYLWRLAHAHASGRNER